MQKILPPLNKSPDGRRLGVLPVVPPPDTYEPDGSAQPHIHPSPGNIDTENEVSLSVRINMRYINNGGDVSKDREVGKPDSTTGYSPTSDVKGKRGTTEPTTSSEVDIV